MSYIYTSIEHAIATTLGARSAVYSETIQTLWSGYGEIIRCRLTDCYYQGRQLNSVIVKYVKPPPTASHPHGWNTLLAHNRKMQSYQVERHWYQSWSKLCGPTCRVADTYFVKTLDNTSCLVIEDLDAVGFSRRVSEPCLEEVRLCLTWLANFHSQFMGINDKRGDEKQSLWPVGTYWHLLTRQDELKALEDHSLRAAASDIHRRLSESQFQTLVHGDAKLANFCFGDDSGGTVDSQEVAAVDFQYVGAGSGIKDIVLLLSSCFTSEGCFKYAPDLLDFYFKQLKIGLESKGALVDFYALEQEWRSLYTFAWADFIRFIKGWRPGHWKVHEYSEKMTQMALSCIG